MTQHSPFVHPVQAHDVLPLSLPSHGTLGPLVAAVCEFNAYCARSIPLPWLLEGAPARIASALQTPVVSIFLRDRGTDTLTMRGNVGFDRLALGRVRLAIGDGLTGMAVSANQVLSAAFAPQHSAYHSFPELNEERYPVFAVAPLLDDHEPMGAVTIQREANPFSDGELALLASLAGTLSVAIHAADARQGAASTDGRSRRAGGGTKRLFLPGSIAIPGRVLGPLAAVRRPPRRSVAPVAASTRLLQDGWAAAERTLRELKSHAERAKLEASFLDVYLQILDDSRFRGRALELASEGVPTGEALGQVAREAVRTAKRWTRSSFLERRASDIEDLCDALTMLSAADPRASMPSRTILMSDSLTVYDLLVTARSRPVGVVLTERAEGPRTRVLLDLLGLPAILNVVGLFQWASDGDIALLDASQGILLINPSRGEVVALRAALDCEAAELRSERA